MPPRHVDRNANSTLSYGLLFGMDRIDTIFAFPLIHGSTATQRHPRLLHKILLPLSRHIQFFCDLVKKVRVRHEDNRHVCLNESRPKTRLPNIPLLVCVDFAPIGVNMVCVVLRGAQPIVQNTDLFGEMATDGGDGFLDRLGLLMVCIGTAKSNPCCATAPTRKTKTSNKYGLRPKRKFVNGRKNFHLLM